MKKRFIGRWEPFGLLFFDRKTKAYSNLNRLAGDVIFALENNILEEYVDFACADLPPGQAEELKDTLKSFVESAEVMGYIDKSGRPDIEWLNERKPWKQMGQSLSAPVSVYFEVTGKCNLKCKHCGLADIRVTEKELSLGEIENLFIQMERMGTMEVSMLGGEPFARSDFFEILRMAANRRFIVYISSNGTLLTENVLKELESLNISGLKISMEGYCRQQYDEIRGPGVFDRFVSTLKLLRDSSLNHIIGFTVTKKNYMTMDSVMEFAVSHGIKAIMINNVKRWGSKNKLLLSPEEHSVFLHEMITDIIPRYHDRIRIGLPPSMYPVESDGLYLYDNFGCSAGNSALHIDPTGKVSPCNFIRTLSSDSSLRQKSLAEIWHDDESFLKLRSLKVPEKCRKCEYYIPCRGGCRAHPDDLNEADPYCMAECGFSQY